MGALHQDAFLYTLFGLHVVYVAILFGLFEQESHYVKVVDFWVKVYMSIFLLWRFNPIFPGRFDDFDRQMVFGSGVLLFTSTIVTEYLMEYVVKAKKLARKVGRGILDGLPTNV